MIDQSPRPEDAQLIYVTYTQPGIYRVRAGQTFRYFDPDGLEIHSPEILARIAHLALPLAWTDVWICAIPNGYLQTRRGWHISTSHACPRGSGLDAASHRPLLGLA